MRCLTLGVLFVSASSSFAIVPGNLSDTNTSDFTFVGQVNGASGVLVGPNTVLTARHVGANPFTLPGIGTFNVVSGSVVSHPTDDIMLFRIDTGSTVLTDYAEINVNVVPNNTAITMVGFGASGTLNAAGTGYDINISSGTRRKGNAIMEFRDLVDERDSNGNILLRAHSLFAPLRSNGQAALVGGDSGGGWFLQGTSGRKQLVGINSFIGSVGSFPSFFFSTSPTNFFTSGAVDLSQYNSWFRQNNVSVVPEPTTIAVLGLGLVALRRKRK